MTNAFWLGFAFCAALFSGQPGEVPETYVVQPGDTCMGVAKKFFGSASEYPRLHQLNELGPLPHKLQPGTLLRLRADKPALNSDALLATFSSTVNTRSATMGEWKPARPQQPLFRGDEVHTLSGAFADILFQDASTLQMKQNALIVIYGGTSSKVHFRKAAGIQLLEGELGVSLANLRKPPAAIVTPSAEIAMRAKEALIHVDAQQTSRVSVHEGEAHVTAQGKSVRLQSGQGTRVKKNAAPEAPVPLPAPPSWVEEGTQAATAQLQWVQPASPPALFRVEVAQEAAFQNLLLEATTQECHFSLAELAPGTFYVRVRALSEAGLVSAPSPTKRLEVVRAEEASTQEAARGEAEEVPLEGEGVLKEVPAVAQEAWEAKRYAQAPAPSPEYVQPLAILRERRLGGLPLPSSYLPRHLQVNGSLDMDFSREKTGLSAAKMATRLDVPWKQGNAFVNVAFVNYASPHHSLLYPELATGTHMQFSLSQHWTAGWAADFSGRLNACCARPSALLRLRGMGILGYQTKAFSVSTTQGVAGEGVVKKSADFLHAAWIGSISASWHIRPKFLVAAQWDGQKISSHGLASAAAAGFRFLVGPTEIGVTGHAGLTSEGRSQWGDYGASLTLGIR